MIQIEIHTFGPPEVLVPVEARSPVPRAGDVVVNIEAAGVTFVDTQVRAGRPPWPGPPPRLPLVLGNGVVGRVSCVGDGVPPALVGCRVVTATGGQGGYASQVAVAVDGLHHVPESSGAPQLLSAFTEGRTALAIVRAADLRPGVRVLVLPAAGGVGSMLVQLAVRAGAEVIGVASERRKRAHVVALGAAACVSYEQIGEVGAVDVALDGVGGTAGGAALDVVRDAGRAVIFGAASGAFTASAPGSARDVQIATLPELIRGPSDNRDLIEESLRLVVSGEVRPTVGASYSLVDAAAAHVAIEARATTGKTVLLP